MAAPQTLPLRLIGALFVERGLVSESQIRVALEIQRESGQQLGQGLDVRAALGDLGVALGHRARADPRVVLAEPHVDRGEDSTGPVENREGRSTE